MQQTHKSRQSSEAKRKALLTRSARLRSDAKHLGVDPHLLETLDTTEASIKSARVEIRKYRDFLTSESTQLDTLQETLHMIKATNQRNMREGLKAAAYSLLLICMPNIAISKLYYLAIIPNPKHIPASSAYVYLIAGDILFCAWFMIGILSSIAFSTLRIRYIIPFTKRYPSLKFLTNMASASIFICLYGQFLYYSASLTPKLITPSWGPSLTNTTNLLITILLSSPIAAFLVLVGLFPVVKNLFKWFKQALSRLRPTSDKKDMSAIAQPLSELRRPIKVKKTIS